MKHIQTHGYGKLPDFEQVLPNIDRKHIQNLLSEMKSEGDIFFEGSKRTGAWKSKSSQ
jgi:hypothetical protein